MQGEINGKIINLLDKESGIILGEDENEYTFSKRDLLTNFDLEVDKEVIFKPTKYVLSKKIVYKANMIEKK